MNKADQQHEEDLTGALRALAEKARREDAETQSAKGPTTVGKHSVLRIVGAAMIIALIAALVIDNAVQRAKVAQLERQAMELQGIQKTLEDAQAESAAQQRPSWAANTQPLYWYQDLEILTYRPPTF